MNRIVFLLEERSTKELLQGLLPRLFPGLTFLCLAHEGKRDLEQSIPRKMRAWREPGVRFVVIRDNDGADCEVVRQSLVTLATQSGRPDTVVRIACQELEAWYFGDLSAVALAFAEPGIPRLAVKAAYRDPDAIPKPSRELSRLVPSFQKVSGARRLAAHLSMNNGSSSYQATIAAIASLNAQMGASP